MILGAVTLMVPELSSGATEVVSPKTYANPRVFFGILVILHSFGSFRDLGFEAGFGGSWVCVVCVVCGGSDLRSLSRSSTAGGAKTTPEQMCVPL